MLFFRKKITAKNLRETAFRKNRKRWRKQLKSAYVELKARIDSEASSGATYFNTSPQRLNRYDVACRLFALRHKDISHNVRFWNDEEGRDRATHIFSWK
jgi:hypothetical protein